MDEQALIDAEVARIEAGPHSGMFTFLHHKGPIIGQSENVMERIDFILSDKPSSEILIRLQHIYRLPENFQEAIATAEKAYQEAIATAEKAYQEAKATAEKAYQEAKATAGKAAIAIIPNCKWNGKTIFGNGPHN